MVCNALDGSVQVGIPDTVKNIGAGIITKPVDTGKPYLLTVLVYDFVAFYMEPVIGGRCGYLQCTWVGSGLITTCIRILLLLVTTLVLILVSGSRSLSTIDFCSIGVISGNA